MIAGVVMWIDERILRATRFPKAFLQLATRSPHHTFVRRIRKFTREFQILQAAPVLVKWHLELDSTQPLAKDQ